MVPSFPALSFFPVAAPHPDTIEPLTGHRARNPRTTMPEGLTIVSSWSRKVTFNCIFIFNTNHSTLAINNNAFDVSLRSNIASFDDDFGHRRYFFRIDQGPLQPGLNKQVFTERITLRIAIFAGFGAHVSHVIHSLITLIRQSPFRAVGMEILTIWQLAISAISAGFLACSAHVFDIVTAMTVQCPTATQFVAVDAIGVWFLRGFGGGCHCGDRLGFTDVQLSNL